MIVENSGYLKVDDVKKLEKYSIYNTHKNTHILIKDTSENIVYLYLPKQDRLPYKLVEGKHICHGIKVFDSELNSFEDVDVSKWNNGNQIMSYTPFTYFYL